MPSSPTTPPLVSVESAVVSSSEDAASSDFVTTIVYVFVVSPSSAVTVQVIVFSPSWRSSFPLIATFAAPSFAGALTVMEVTSLETAAVYSVTSAENAGFSVPGEISRDDRDAALIFTEALPTWSSVTALESAS